MSRIIMFTVGLALIVCGSVFVPRSQDTVNVSDEEISGIVVGGPVTECADCSEPSCTGGICYAHWDPVGGWMCRRKLDAFFANESNCNGGGLKSPYCHLINYELCWWLEQYEKNESYECTYDVSCKPYHEYISTVETHYAYDDCVESESDPH